MIFKHAYLARLGIQKTFTHGYVQSLVAASQSSSASHNTSFHTLSNNVVSYFGKNGTVQPQHHAHQTLSQSNGGGARTGGQTDQPQGGEDGLAAYYAAWYKHQRNEEREWHQFQFAKRIGWKAPTTIPDPEPKAAVARPAEAPDHLSLGLTRRPRSTSAVDDFNKKKDAAGAAEGRDPLATLDLEGASDRIVGIQEAPEAATTSPELSSDVSSASMQSIDVPSLEQSTKASSVAEADTYGEHLSNLADQQKYGEIPALFEFMLSNGITPSPSAYNALLIAAINLPKGKHHVVPKVLDVYSDMMRRRVTPDTSTYTVLIEVLAYRALDVAAMMSDLKERQKRISGVEKEASFLFRSDETEFKILAEDDALTLAVKLFDASAASQTKHTYSPETYCVLLTACAEQGRISDMVRIYAEMESEGVTPPTAIFAPMIKAFARAGDLRSSVECYDEYKALAVAHDQGETLIVRNDEEIYAALIKAYSLCDRAKGGLKFLSKIEEELQDTDRLAVMRDTVALQALIPAWLEQDRHEDAISHTLDRLSTKARHQALTAICIDAADKNNGAVASEAFALLPSGMELSASSAVAMLAMHLRNGEIKSARTVWGELRTSRPSIDMVETTAVYALNLIESGNAHEGLLEARHSFARIRDLGTVLQSDKQDVIDAIDEAIEVLGHHVFNGNSVVSSQVNLDLIRLMFENERVVNPLAERAVAVLGPAEIAALSVQDINMLLQVQAGLLINRTHLDVAHVPRFGHLLEVLASTGVPAETRTAKLVEQTLEKINRPDLTARWQSLNQYPVSPQMFAQSPFAQPQFAHPQYANFYPAQTPTSSQPAYDDTYDPYAASTDFKGSTAIADELEKTWGRHSTHLNEALTKFRNMRRTGRHPRYVTYAKLINAAAKENRISLAHDIVAMAKQDVPPILQSSVVTHGWVTILDAMVGACLTMNKRDIAAQYHQELSNMGAAPSANTFGLYITTLKDSTKTFDEATEAVKIFQRAKMEGVEPSSFLYNALIGKLGKARRIDDCLFYFAEMRKQGIRPTSVTYGTIVNALCRVSDDKFAEELFEEMESMPNYKARPAPYNSMMQYFLSTKRDRSKVLWYYDRMRTNSIQPTMHTYKLLIDTYASLDPVDLPAAERVLDEIREAGEQPEAVHYASLIHAKGCVLHDLDGARATFDAVLAEGKIPPQASLYQALFESMVANHDVAATQPLLEQMSAQGVAMTPYVANTLIHGWALAGDISKAKAVYESLGMDKREPSTYEAMTRAYLAAEQHGNAMSVVGEALRRGYPAAVANKISDLVSGGGAASSPVVGRSSASA